MSTIAKSSLGAPRHSPSRPDLPQTQRFSCLFVPSARIKKARTTIPGVQVFQCDLSCRSTGDKDRPLLWERYFGYGETCSEQPWTSPASDPSEAWFPHHHTENPTFPTGLCRVSALPQPAFRPESRALPT